MLVFLESIIRVSIHKLRLKNNAHIRPPHQRTWTKTTRTDKIFDDPTSKLTEDTSRWAIWCFGDFLSATKTWAREAR